MFCGGLFEKQREHFLLKFNILITESCSFDTFTLLLPFYYNYKLAGDFSTLIFTPGGGGGGGGGHLGI